MRVVSLVPSTTETLLAWGVDVVACTRFCEQPHLRHVGGTKDPDVAAIVELAPDLVVVDRQENRREDAAALAAAGLRVHVTDVVALADVAPALTELASAVGVAASPAGLPPADPPWARAFVPIWRRPWMAIGADTYGSTLLHHIGVVNVLGGAPERYPSVDPAAIAELEPDLVLLPTEPYAFRQRHVDELAGILPRSRTLVVDGQDLFWWGVRTPGAIERLRAALR